MSFIKFLRVRTRVGKKINDYDIEITGDKIIRFQGCIETTEDFQFDSKLLNCFYWQTMRKKVTISAELDRPFSMYNKKHTIIVMEIAENAQSQYRTNFTSASLRRFDMDFTELNVSHANGITSLLQSVSSRGRNSVLFSQGINRPLSEVPVVFNVCNVILTHRPKPSRRYNFFGQQVDKYLSTTDACPGGKCCMTVTDRALVLGLPSTHIMIIRYDQMLGGHFIKTDSIEEDRAELVLFLTASDDEEYITLTFPLTDFRDLKHFFINHEQIPIAHIDGWDYATADVNVKETVTTSNNNAIDVVPTEVVTEYSDNKDIDTMDGVNDENNESNETEMFMEVGHGKKENVNDSASTSMFDMSADDQILGENVTDEHVASFVNVASTYMDITMDSDVNVGLIDPSDQPSTSLQMPFAHSPHSPQSLSIKQLETPPAKPPKQQQLPVSQSPLSSAPIGTPPSIEPPAPIQQSSAPSTAQLFTQQHMSGSRTPPSDVPIETHTPIETLAPIETSAPIETPVSIGTCVPIETSAPIVTHAPIRTRVPIETITPVGTLPPVEPIASIEQSFASIAKLSTQQLMPGSQIPPFDVPIETSVASAAQVSTQQQTPGKHSSPQSLPSPSDTVGPSAQSSLQQDGSHQQTTDVSQTVVDPVLLANAAASLKKNRKVLKPAPIKSARVKLERAAKYASKQTMSDLGQSTSKLEIVKAPKVKMTREKSKPRAPSLQQGDGDVTDEESEGEDLYIGEQHKLQYTAQERKQFREQPVDVRSADDMDAAELKAGFILYRSYCNDDRIIHEQNMALLEEAAAGDPRRATHKANVKYLQPIVQSDIINGWLSLKWDELSSDKRKALLLATATHVQPGYPFDIESTRDFIIQLCRTVDQKKARSETAKKSLKRRREAEAAKVGKPAKLKK